MSSSGHSGSSRSGRASEGGWDIAFSGLLSSRKGCCFRVLRYFWAGKELVDEEAVSNDELLREGTLHILTHLMTS